MMQFLGDERIPEKRVCLATPRTPFVFVRKRHNRDRIIDNGMRRVLPLSDDVSSQTALVC